MTALVSFDRVFEVLDLEPLIKEKPGAAPLPARDAAGTAPSIAFDDVSFRYPTAAEVSLASLESIALKQPERTDAAAGVLHDISFTAPRRASSPRSSARPARARPPSPSWSPGCTTRTTARCASAATTSATSRWTRCTTWSAWSPRTRTCSTTRSAPTCCTRGPAATEAELVEACGAAQIWDLISVLPDGLDTIVGDRGYRLSGGEKQRRRPGPAAAEGPVHRGARRGDRAPGLGVGGRRAAGPEGRAARAGPRWSSRTGCPPIREADQILVIEAGQVAERGTHEELLAAGGLYAELYQTQFKAQENQEQYAELGDRGHCASPGLHRAGRRASWGVSRRQRYL